MKLRHMSVIAGPLSGLLLLMLSPAQAIPGNSAGSGFPADPRPMRAEALIEEGDTYRLNKEYRAALLCYQQAIILTAGDFDSTDFHHNPAGPLHSPAPLMLLKALSAKADLLNERYLLTRKRAALQTAFETYMLSIFLIEKIQADVTQEVLKLDLRGENYRVFGGAMLAAYNLYRLTGSRWYLQASFAIAEQGKARVAVEYLHEKEYAAYGKKTDRQLPDLDTVQKKLLKEDQIALHYLMGEKNIFVLAISRTRVTIHKLPSGGTSDHVEAIRASLKHRDRDSYRLHASLLYRQLIGPVQQRISGFSQLLIIPDHILHYLPFELLFPGITVEEDPLNRPYLIRDYQISYAPSFSIYREMKIEKNIKTNRMLALAPYVDVPPKKPESGFHRIEGGLAPLPLTRYEIESIARMFRFRKPPGDLFEKRHVTLLWNEHASVKRLNEMDLSEYGYIHFATHAYYNKDRPEGSGLSLADDGSGKNVIYLKDVYKMKFNARLIVLSACETGLGTLARGEGVIGFTRAFIHSGALNLLVSMWRVSDRASSELMVRFYRELFFNGSGKAEALRAAKLSLIDRPETAFPADWASFILIGS